MNATRTERITAITPLKDGRYKVWVCGFEIPLSFLIKPELGDMLEFYLTPLFDGVVHKSVVIHLTPKQQVGTPIFARVDLNFGTGLVKECAEGRISGHEYSTWEDQHGDTHQGILKLLVDVDGVTHETPALDADTYWSLKPLPTTALDLILEDWDEPLV